MCLLAGCSYGQYHIVHLFHAISDMIELLLNEKLIAFAPNLVFSQAVYILQKDTEDNP
jgi:hypothetical protein